jgi:phenylacetate-coenzyme A ligase PaaK-like adenylate-forming protein
MGELSSQLHDQLSQRLLLPLSRLQRLARSSRRAQVRAFYEGIRFRRSALQWSGDQRNSWMLDRLRFVVRRAYRETDYYRSVFKDIGFDPETDFSYEDFAKLPILDRNQIHAAGEDLRSKAVNKEDAVLQATGGSTGAPTEVWFGPEERGWAESGTEMFMRRIGVPTGARTALLWGHHLDPQAQDGFRDRYHSFEQNQRWFDCLRLSPEKLEQYHQELMRWRPACVIAYASAAGQLAEHVAERGHQANYPSRCFVTGAEKLWPQHRTAIQEAFGRPVHERYGARDAGGIGFQVDPSRTLDYEIDWANSFVEPESTDPESAILITKLHADAMPMIRYRVGDVGRFPGTSSPGMPAFTLHEVLGRVADRIWLPNGGWVSGLEVPHMMKDYPVREFVFLQRADYSIEIQIVPRNGFADDCRDSILKTVSANLPGLNISLELVGEIKRTKSNKWRPVISEVRLAAV